jgi:DNA-binding Lrp family transcriptional regulator
MGRPSIRADTEMQRLMDRLGPSLPPLSGRILRYLDDGVVERDGCVLLKALQPAGSSFDAQRHHDRTGYECAVNRLEFEGRAGTAERALATALTYAGQLVDMLDRSGAAGPFRVILTHDPREGGCSVRFHRLRPGERWRGSGTERAGPTLLLDCAAPQSDAQNATR